MKLKVSCGWFGLEKPVDIDRRMLVTRHGRSA